MSCTHTPGPACPARAGPEDPGSLAKRKQRLLVPVPGPEESGPRGPSPSADIDRPPRPHIPLPVEPEPSDGSTPEQAGPPWVRQPPPAPEGLHVELGMSLACWLSVLKPGLCSLGYFPPLLMFIHGNPACICPQMTREKMQDREGETGGLVEIEGLREKETSRMCGCPCAKPDNLQRSTEDELSPRSCLTTRGAITQMRFVTSSSVAGSFSNLSTAL